MNNKVFKTISYIFIIIGVLFINIPFAAAKENIEISNVSITDHSSTLSLDELNYSNNNISSNISFKELNDFVTLEIELLNDSGTDYILDSINSNNNYLTISTEDKNTKIKNHSTTTITIKVVYSSELVNQDTISLNDYTISFFFKTSNEIVNPLTIRNGLLFTALIVIISIVSLFFLPLKKKTIKNILLPLLLLAIPVYVYAQENLNVYLSFSDVSIKGRFLDYTVLVNHGDGTIEQSVKTYGDTVGELPSIEEKEGYTADGWIDQNGEVITSDTVVTGDLEIEPKYDLIYYSLTYNLDGGLTQSDNPEEYTIEDEIVLNNPEKEGYTFRGWSNDGGETFQTNVTIAAGSTGNKEYTAYYSPNDGTKYKVIHKYQNLDLTSYEEVVQELTGATDTEVTPLVIPRTGYVSPEFQTVTISGDGETKIEYTYNREMYSFNITDRTYIVGTSTQNGTYPYGTTIVLKANSRTGYNFRWSDGNDSLDRSFELTGPKTITAIYTAKTDTPYKVIHKLMNMDGRTYSIKDEVLFTGTTDAEIEPDTNVYEGFTAPQKQRVTIKGDGTTKVIYEYTRNKYTLTLENPEYIETTTPSGEYYYGTTITLRAINRNNHDFIKWSNDNTNREISFVLKSDITLRAIYSNDEYVIVFNVNGGTEIDESIMLISPGNSITSLPETTRYGYYFDGWYTDMTYGEKVTSGFFPNSDLELYARWKVSLESAEIANETINIAKTFSETINITNASQIQETYTFTSNNQSIATVNSNGVVTGVSPGTTTITIRGNISDKTKVVTVVVISNEYLISFNSNGGTISQSNKTIIMGNTIGTLPTGAKTNCYLDGWYTSLTNGEKVTESYVPNGSIELFAIWKQSIEVATISNQNIDLNVGEEETITITNSNQIEESYTFTSNNTSVATVTSAGKVKGISSGTATITIRGAKSNKTKTVNVTVVDPNTGDFYVTYNANGGKFSDNTTVKAIPYNVVKKYSHTSNVDDTGKKNSDYGNSWTNANITGTDRGSTSNAHVVTIPGASQLTVDIYYNGESTAYDWVTIWKGSYPNYTAYSNSSSGITNGQKLGGSQTGTYTVNGNTLSSMGHSTFTINGDTVTFGFRSDSSVVGNGYGYYAIVSGYVPVTAYEEPTKGQTEFHGWYKDANCTTGQEFNGANTDTTVYACWGSTITYNSNGGTTASPSTKFVKENTEIGTHSTSTKSGYYIDGWYTLIDGGEKVSETFIPTTSTTIYAHWKKSVTQAVIAPPEIILDAGEEQQLSILNPTDVEETYSYESSNQSIVTIDSNGVARGVSAGTTTVLLRGTKSNQTKSVSITVVPSYTITYNSTTGTFNDGSTINQVTYSPERIKYSYTSNIDATGKKKSNYGNSWTNANITGTDRGDTSKAHVVTIPNAKSLTVDIYYNGESTSYDWVTIWEGSHPTYTAYNNSSSGITNGQKLGGYQSGTYTVYGNSLSGMGHSTFTINGDTVTFGFRSDGSGYGNGYGYYAIIRGREETGTYKTPTKANREFYNWYKDSNCTVGQEDDTTGTTTRTLYAGYSYTLTYDVNGGNALSSTVKQVKEGSSLGSLPLVSRTGYYSDFWYIQGNESSKVTTSYVPTDNLTISAHWIKSVAGMEIASTSLATSVGRNVQIEISNPSEIEEEYTFTSNNTSVVTVDNTGVVTGVAAGTTTITIKGKTSNQTKTINVSVIPFDSYNITLDSNGGDINETITYVSVVPIGILPTPKNDNYVFLGWYTDIQNGFKVEPDYYPTGDMILYARWSNKKEYTVTFDSNGGTEVESVTVEEGNTIDTLPTPQKDQYHFNGWYTNLTNGIKVSDGYSPTSDSTLYAYWSNATPYTVTFDANEGSVSETTRSVYSDTPIGNLPTPTRTSYSFVGWLDESTNTYYSSQTIPTGNVTLKAQWNTTNYVARINNNYYSSISNAISSASENDTIVLIKNTSETFTNNKKITLDLNGYKITGGLTNSSTGDLTIKNGTIEGTSSNTNIITNTGKLTLGTSKYNQNDKISLISNQNISQIYGVSGGTVIVNNAEINLTGTCSSGIYGISANKITMNYGNININNNSAGSSANAYGINFKASQSTLEINDGVINTISAYDSSAVAVNYANTNITINGGILYGKNTITTKAAKAIYFLSSNNTFIMNGGSLSSDSPFRGLTVYCGSSYSNNTVIIKNGTISVGPATSNSSYGGMTLCSESGSTKIIVTGGKYQLTYGTSETGSRIVYNQGTTYLYGGEFVAKPSSTSLRSIYPIYISSGKVNYYGGEFKIKASNAAFSNTTSSLYLPPGKQVTNSVDSDGYRVYSLTNS